MNGLTVINKVASEFGINSRTLRHWETAGLFTSTRDVLSGWRMYDEQALERIRVTDLLRRLDFSINDIKEILEKRTVESLCHVLKKQLSRLNKTSSDLEMRKETINELIVVLETELTFTLSSLENILLPVALERKKHVIKKLHGGFEMENAKNKFDDVKYINLAPARAVAFNAVSKEPEGEAMEPVFKWITENNFESTARIYLFNIDPYQEQTTDGSYGMGCCATIPEGQKIPEHLYEKKLPGGIYAVLEDDGNMGIVERWEKMGKILRDPEWEWEYDGREGCRGLEEHIERVGGGSYISVMLPVKKKQRS